MLASKGFAIAFVSENADDAVDRYLGCEKKPDLVIMDRRLKESSGVDAACRIAASDPGARFLFATADADPGLVDTVPGVVEILQKPFAMVTLFTAIERGLSRDEGIPQQRRQASSLA
jgi:DNA-binding NtrC family response regulator